MPNFMMWCGNLTSFKMEAAPWNFTIKTFSNQYGSGVNMHLCDKVLDDYSNLYWDVVIGYFFFKTALIYHLVGKSMNSAWYLLSCQIWLELMHVLIFWKSDFKNKMPIHVASGWFLHYNVYDILLPINTFLQDDN